MPGQIEAYGVRLRPLREEDIELVRHWRNHPDVSRYMFSDEYISAAQQRAWFERISGARDRAYYLFEYRGEPCGFASVTTPAGEVIEQAEELEAAIYLAPECPFHGNLLAFAPALALNDACFAQLPVERLIARVKETNSAALRFNAAMGYHESARRDGVVYLALSREAYDTGAARIKALLSRNRS